MKVLYLDESGDHNLTIIDPRYPVFVLGGIIVDQDYAEDAMTVALNDFKLEVFGTTNIVLHTSDIMRNRNGFECLIDKSFREHFYLRLNELMRNLSYKVVACVVRKDKHLQQYGALARNPYFLSLDVLVERFCFELGNVFRGGTIVAERRDPTLDHGLEIAWLNLKISGTNYLQANAVENRVVGLDLRGKTENLAGLQLADLVVSPIGRHTLGKHDYEDWRIVESKLRRDAFGRTQGFGLVTLPK
jgi:hypothetical protein